MKQIVTLVFLILIIFGMIFHKKYNIRLPWQKPLEEVSHLDKATAVTAAQPVVNQNNTQAVTESFDMEIFKPQPNDILLGSPDSKVIIVEYSSPTCPHCSYYHKEIYPQIKTKYIDSGKVAYILREFITNKQDLDAALLGRCLKDKNDPLKLFQVIYAQQDKWASNKNYRQILENLGQLAGISQEQYDKCLNDKVLIEFLANHSRTISFYKDFPGTPSFFVNAKLHKGAYSVEVLSQTIESALNDVKPSANLKDVTKNDEAKQPEKKVK
ncbi:MAG: hypothetical protein RLZZ59_69 [Pseudomonadota bacterium]|jgi:protein-disulfide isomerase